MRIRLGVLALVAVPLILAADDGKDSRPRVRFGGFTVNAGYMRYPEYPYLYGYGYGPYAYDPFLFSPYLHPGYFTGFGYHPAMGELKVQTADRSSWVYLDGALAGRADKLKTMWLEPGAYQLEVRSAGRKYQQKIYVLSGKTFRVTPGMMEARP